MATHRVWRDGIDSPPPDTWTFIYVPGKVVHDKTTKNWERDDYRNISWWDNVYTWASMPEQQGHYTYRFGNSLVRFEGDDAYLFAFSDPDTAFQFKILWT